MPTHAHKAAAGFSGSNLCSRTTPYMAWAEEKRARLSFISEVWVDGRLVALPAAARHAVAMLREGRGITPETEAGLRLLPMGYQAALGLQSAPRGLQSAPRGGNALPPGAPSQAAGTEAVMKGYESAGRRFSAAKATEKCSEAAANPAGGLRPPAFRTPNGTLLQHPRTAGVRPGPVLAGPRTPVDSMQADMEHGVVARALLGTFEGSPLLTLNPYRTRLGEFKGLAINPDFYMFTPAYLQRLRLKP